MPGVIFKTTIVCETKEQQDDIERRLLGITKEEQQKIQYRGFPRKEKNITILEEK